MNYQEALACYLADASNDTAVLQPSEHLSELQDDGVWCLANVNGAIALVDEDGAVLVCQGAN